MKFLSVEFVISAIRNFVSESIGTAVFVFTGCMGLCRGINYNGGHTGAALCFGMALFLGIQIACHISGGHVNPAVTVLSLFFRKISIPMAVIYIFAQLIGGLLGFGLVKAVTPENLINLNGFEEHGLCSTVPNPKISLVQAVLAEFILSVALFLFVCSEWDPRNQDTMILKFGFAVYPLAYAGAHYTGCSLNPARSFGPAVWNNSWTHHWIYWLCPLSAAIICGLGYTLLFIPKSIRKEMTQKSNKEETEGEVERP